MFAASLFVEYRLPELFCGFYRRDGEGPVPYPVACAPQSWSAASVFLLIQAILGMKIDAAASRLSFVRPVLPEFLDEIQIKNLKVGTGSVDLRIHRRARYATVEIERREGSVEVSTKPDAASFISGRLQPVLKRLRMTRGFTIGTEAEVQRLRSFG